MSRQQHAPQKKVRLTGLKMFRCCQLRFGSIPGSMLYALALACISPVAAQTGNTSSTCASGLFSDPNCQAVPSQTMDSTSSSTGQYINSQALPQVSQQPYQGTNGSQVYVDSAGGQFQHTTSQTDRNQQLFPPDPVTDFQKLAHSSTGETIPVFGRDLFQRAPSTFAPADEIPVTPDYVLGPGDEVLVRLWGAEQTTSNDRLTVDTSGDIYVPRVGTVHVAGLHASELQDRISAEVSHIFRNYRISVSLGRLRSIQVYIVGEARRPGAYTVSGLSTVLNALFASGGPSVQGSMRRIQVRRAGQTLTEIDLYDLLLRGDKSHDVRLETGDTIFIPPVGPQAAIAGSVRHPAIYELKNDAASTGSGTASTTLNDLLNLAGGFSPTAAPGKLRLERIDATQHRTVVTINLDADGQAMPLRDGDVLYAEHISPGYQQSVTIRGNLANPGRFAWKPGMRLRDIIPDRESLLTSDYWRMRNSLGVPVPLFEPFEYSPQATLPYTQTVRGTNPLSTGLNPLAISRSNLNSVLPPGQEDSLQQAGLATGGIVSRDSTLQDQTATNEIASTSTDNRTANQNGGASSGTANGTMANPNANRTQTPPQPVLGINQIRVPAPDINWSYAVIERLNPTTLKTELLPFHLGRLVQDADASQNLALQPNDVVTILNQRDILVPQQEQTKFIRLEGEFVGAGVYSVGPNETLNQVILRAGGFTPNAYLYGSSFLRESARSFQQQRLDEYITQLSADMQRATAVRGASTPTGVSDPNALALERNIISQLRQLRATGRVVLEFAPDSQGVGTVPNIQVENGDVFRVPSRPSTVSVIGAVYGQNVFLFNPQRHLEDYLALAGKPNRIADKTHAFIIRADGSIYSRELAKGTFSNHFDEARINPGDSIVIPEKLIKPTALRQLLDYSQILSSFGLAAAAINVVK